MTVTGAAAGAGAAGCCCRLLPTVDAGYHRLLLLQLPVTADGCNQLHMLLLLQ